MSVRYCFLFLILFASYSNASTLAGAVVDKLMVDSANGDILFVSATGTFTETGCTTNTTWEFVLPLNSDL
jgi:hypothetical protein